MSLGRILATAARVLRQLSHDHRTLVLIFLMPSVLLILLNYVFEGSPQTFDRVAPMLLGIFPLTMMFLITSIATVRERTSGTLDRLMTTRITRLDFMLGYALAFSLVALIQALLASLVLTELLGVSVAAGTGALLVSAILSAFLGTALGLLMSAFATTEFQAVQFMPAIIFPQILTCGLFIPREQMASFLEHISDFLPLTYSVDAMKLVTTQANLGSDWRNDLIIVAVCGLAALTLGALTIRRQE